MSEVKCSLETIQSGVEYCPDSDTYHTVFSDGETATTAVVTALAAVRHRDITEIETIYADVDTDALNALIASADDPATRVEFTVDGFEVTVYGDNGIEIVPPV